jgi:hypothetical protein
MAHDELVHGFGLEPVCFEQFAAGRSHCVGCPECWRMLHNHLDVRFKLERVCCVSDGTTQCSERIGRMLLMAAFTTGYQFVQFGISVVL